MLEKWVTPAVMRRFRPYRSTFFLLLPYVLSWVLVMFACVFGRIAYVLYSETNKNAVTLPHSPTAWTSESRPNSPLSMDTLSASYNSQLYPPLRNNLSVPHSPFCIAEEERHRRYSDDPPSYAEVMAVPRATSASFTALSRV
ncbi:unnamed protein product [Nippostrongylus brasiliensis]|uniref:Seipin n=1 Tax=Nippostrongylus brasiliensis TaxID=27835 RepID=A0A0N4YJD0_NIPBR|nr:unnamed protein product [Nippostrongylus brasiliensis]